jgi:hypothetical protein
VRSYTIPLINNQLIGAPSIIDHWYFVDPAQGSSFTYPNTAFGGRHNTTTFDLTGDDGSFSEWKYSIQDVVEYINVGPLKGPYTINFDASNLDTSIYPILKIEYDFGDGQILVVNRDLVKHLTQGQYLTAGDPKTVPVSHAYYPQSTSGMTVYNPKITVFNADLVSNVYYISISSTAASIYEFNDIHLINTSQQFSIIESRNIFEIEQPNYLTVGKVLSAFDSNHATSIPFNPSRSLPTYSKNLVLWLDAKDAFTIAKDYNYYVTRWSDKSSYNNDFYSTGATKPFYLYDSNSFSKRKSIQFRGLATMTAAASGLNTIFSSSDSINGPGYTMFIVMQSNTVGGTVFSYDVAGVTVPIPNINMSFDSANNAFIVKQGSQVSSFNNISNNLNGYGLFSITLSGTNNARAYLTADTLMARKTNQNYTYDFSNFYSPNATLACIGYSPAFPLNSLLNAEISEILIYNTPLDPASIATINNYLIDKWELVLKTN